ncbi:YggS family pyridoxal phosphate-dependent enzyme [Paenibacillus kobensis]|uniref:YggS family pyridoxal phosphate-dependent enzyme n=1 Tax=Paenibacillus kobensis TaxID=59841 RepID=UPI000FD862A8|nr:YggS family pyridoxal phosphate-dependent enzyme [Paenibacillus kobensis]
MDALNLNERVELVSSRIKQALMRCGRTEEEVNVIAVTKYGSIENMKEVLEHIRHVGESRWQDAQEKWERLGNNGTWHFIGHLQTNKVKDVLGKFEYIHSMDRISLAQEIEKKAAQLGITVKCFLQVNVSGEATKQGMAPDQVMAFAETLRKFKQIQVMGLMTMAPHETRPEDARPVFKALRQLRDEINARGIFDYAVPHLSMGMSNDFEIAIEEGSTWIRLGSAIVGK